jgi:hypothetical protein
LRAWVLSLRRHLLLLQVLHRSPAHLASCCMAHVALVAVVGGVVSQGPAPAPGGPLGVVAGVVSDSL